MSPPRAPTLIEIAIEPREARDRPALLHALADLTAADPASEVRTDGESGQIILGGRDEDHVDALCTALRGRMALRFGAPQVAYRETIEQRIEIDTTHKKPRDGGFEFARVKLAFVPAPGWRFVAAEPGAFPEAFVAGVEAGLARGRRAGVLAGFPVVDVEATMFDGGWHETDSSPAAFETAALTAFRHAQQTVGVLMEPIMTIALTVPEACASTARDDLLLRRAAVARRVTHDDGTVTLKGTVPLANTIGYRNSVRTMSRGVGTFVVAFSHFEPVPAPEPPDFPGAMAAMRALGRQPRPR